MKRLTLQSSLKNFSVYSSRGLIVIYGYNDRTGLYSILEINRPVITTDGGIRMKQLPQEFTLNQIIARKKFMQTSYKDMELLYENIPSIYGCIKLLDSQYLILITKISKIGSIVGHSIYSIDDIAILPVTYGMKNSTDETRYRTLLGTFDFTKYLYFSYTYDLTKSYQLQVTSTENIPLESTISSTSSTSPSSLSSSMQRSPCQHMFVWNSFALKPFLKGSGDGQSLDHWCVPVIYGYINQRNIQLQSNIILKFLLIARRSRLFAGTRYLRRGVDILGHVANEVETEQIFYLTSPQPGYISRVTSLIQCRGSIPLFWSHTNLYSPKPDVQLESDLEMRMTASKKHFENLFIRYGFNINVLNLVKQVDSRGEVMLGAAYKETCDTLLNTFIEMKNRHKKSLRQQQQQQQVSSNTLENTPLDEGEGNKITPTPVPAPLTYIAYDFLTMAKYQHVAESEGIRNGPNVFRDINRICEGIYGNIGFYVDPPINSEVYLHFPIVDIIPPSVQQQQQSQQQQRQTQQQQALQQLEDEGEEELNWEGSNNEPQEEVNENNSKKLLVDEELREQQPQQQSQQQQPNEMYDLFYELLAGDLPTHSLHSDEFLTSLNPTNTLGTGSPTGLLQVGILRTNCMDCLDRTNVAQFCYAKLNIMKQLKSIGINLLTSGLQEVISICMEVWAEHGDAIAIQYGGSGAMHKVDKQDPSTSTQQQQQQMMMTNATPSSSSSSSSPPASSEQEFCLTGGSKNALVAVQRYYSNISTDYDRQQSIDLLLGIYEPKKNAVPIWEEKLRTQHLRFGARGRRHSDLTAAGQHDLNLLLQLDKVSKKEKTRNDLLLQLQQQGGAGGVIADVGNGEGIKQQPSYDGDFLILHDEEDDNAEEGEDDEDEDHDGDDVDEIWEDTPIDESDKKQRKSIRIPLPGYRIANVVNQPYFHIGSLALDSLTEFRDIVEDTDLEVVNLQEIVAFPFPPILINDTLWSTYREKKKDLIKDPVVSSSSMKSPTSALPPVPLSPQEQLYSDYLNLNHTFYPNVVYTICQCTNNRIQQTTPSAGSIPQSSMTSTKKDVSTSLTQRLRQEILQDFYSSQKLSQSLIQSTPQVQSGDRNSEVSDYSRRDSDAVGENQKSIPSTVSNSSPVITQQAPPPVARKGIWPFRRTVKAVTNAETTANESSNATPTSNNPSLVTTNQPKRTDSTDSQSAPPLPLLPTPAAPPPPSSTSFKQTETIVRKPSRINEGLLKRYVENLIDEKLSGNMAISREEIEKEEFS